MKSKQPPRLFALPGIDSSATASKTSRDIHEILRELREHRSLLDEAIHSLEKISESRAADQSNKPVRTPKRRPS